MHYSYSIGSHFVKYYLLYKKKFNIEYCSVLLPPLSFSGIGLKKKTVHNASFLKIENGHHFQEVKTMSPMNELAPKSSRNSVKIYQKFGRF